MSVNSDLFTDIRNVIVAVIPGVEVVQTQVNRVPMPDDGFIALTPINYKRVSTNVRQYIDDGTVTGGQQRITQSQMQAVQIDCYGPLSGDWAATLSTIFRDPFACDTMTKSQPLYADDAIQLPLINGEDQYEERWTLQALFAYTHAVTLPAQFADTANAVTFTPVESLT